MIREATAEDMPELLRMGKTFYESTPWSSHYPFNEARLEETMGKLLSDDRGSLFVSERGLGELDGMIGSLVYDLWPADGMTGQELFWWSESAVGRQLRERAEVWAKELGAGTFLVVAVKELRHESLEQIYRRAGYAPIEQVYLKVI